MSPLLRPANPRHLRQVAVGFAADIVFEADIVAQLVNEARLPIPAVIFRIVNGDDVLELSGADPADALLRGHLVGMRSAGSAPLSSRTSSPFTILNITAGIGRRASFTSCATISASKTMSAANPTATCRRWRGFAGRSNGDIGGRGLHTAAGARFEAKVSCSGARASFRPHASMKMQETRRRCRRRDAAPRTAGPPRSKERAKAKR